MGEARRRKEWLAANKKDSDSINLQTSTSNSLLSNINLRPDYGHWYFNKFGNAEITVFIEHPFSFSTKKEGYICFAAEEGLGTIITSVAQAMKVGSSPVALKIKPSPIERYKTSQTNEWVIPFRIVNFLTA